MKKAFVLLLALAILGGAVFAEDAAYTLTGSASLIWGYDLNTENHGFTNEATATLAVDFVSEQSSTHGEEAITGMLMIEDFSVMFASEVDQNGDEADDLFTGYAGDITAKILFPNGLYLQIASAPGFDIDNAALQAPLSADEWADLTWAYNVNPSIDSAGGFTFGMDGDFSFALNIGSTNQHDYEAAAAGTSTSVVYIATGLEVAATGVTYTTLAGAAQALPLTAGVAYIKVTAGAAAGGDAENDYMVGFDASYALGDMATIGANLIFGAFQADPNTFGLGVYVDATPVEGLTLYLGTDVKMSNDVTGMDLQFDAGYELAGLVSFGAGTYLAIGDFDATTGNPWLGANVRAGLLAVENLTFDLGVDMWNILDAADSSADMDILIGLDVAYMAMLSDVNYVKPYADFSYVLEANSVDAGTVLSVGVEAMLIPMTTFALDFSAGELTADDLAYDIALGSEATQDKGTITFTTTITY